MKDSHYNYMLDKYDKKKNIRLIITDTDSLFYEIKIEDAYKDLYEKKEDQKYFGTSGCPKNIYYSEENKKVIRTI